MTTARAMKLLSSVSVAVLVLGSVFPMSGAEASGWTPLAYFSITATADSLLQEEPGFTTSRGDYILYTMTVHNAGPQRMGVFTVGHLPRGLTLVSGPGWEDFTSPECAPFAQLGRPYGSVRCELGIMGARSSRSVQIAMYVTEEAPCGQYEEFFGSVGIPAVPDALRPSYATAMLVLCDASAPEVPPTSSSLTLDSLSIAMTARSSRVHRSEPLLYDIVVRNEGDLKRGVVVYDNAPEGLRLDGSFVEGSGGLAACEEAYFAQSPDGGTIACALGDMARGQAKNVTLRFQQTVTEPLEVDNIAHVGLEALPYHSLPSLPVTTLLAAPEPPAESHLTLFNNVPDTVFPRDELHVSLTVQNDTQETHRTVYVYNNVPVGYIFDRVLGEGTCSLQPSPDAPTGFTVRCDANTLAPSEAAQFQLAFRPAHALMCGAFISSDAFVWSSLYGLRDLPPDGVSRSMRVWCPAGA